MWSHSSYMSWNYIIFYLLKGRGGKEDFWTLRLITANEVRVHRLLSFVLVLSVQTQCSLKIPTNPPPINSVVYHQKCWLVLTRRVILKSKVYEIPNLMKTEVLSTNLLTWDNLNKIPHKTNYQGHFSHFAENKANEKKTVVLTSLSLVEYYFYIRTIQQKFN